MTPDQEIQMRKDFTDYEINGFLCQQKGILGGNALLATSEKMIILYKSGVLNTADIDNFRTCLSACEMPGTVGLYHRAGDPNSLEAQDDYMGILTASYLCDPTRAKEIYGWGEQHGGSWNNVNPEKWSLNSYFCRSPAFDAHMTLCAGKMPPLTLQIAWSVNMLTSGRSNVQDEDSRTFCWFMLQTEEIWRNNPMMEKAAASWRARFQRDWPGGMRQVMTYYLGNALHPLATYWPI